MSAGGATQAGRDARFTRPGGDLPRAARLGNALARPFAGRIDLSSDAILARALRGLPDGSEELFEFRPALDALCRSLTDEMPMHALGRITARDDTARLARTQIAVNRELRRTPEILETRLPRPIHVIGWPRTGSTVFHSVLCQDPAHRALLYYEGFDPAAPARGGEDTRPRKLANMLRGLEWIQPGYRAIHPMDADSIEECVTVMYHTFSTPQMDIQYHCPGYLAFLEQQGTLEPYRHYRKQLQMLQHYRPHGERWVLKDMTHLIALDTLLELFPDTTFVWIHRDPVRVLASTASMMAHTRALFSDAYDAESCGRDVVDGFWLREIFRGLELRDELPQERFIDVRYADFMERPLETVASVYASLGLELGFEARDAMQRFLRERPQGSEGTHRYTPEQFGIDAGTVRERTRDYCERFDIPGEH